MLPTILSNSNSAGLIVPKISTMFKLVQYLQDLLQELTISSRRVTTPGANSDNTRLIIIIACSIGGGLLLILIILVIICLCRRRRNKAQESTEKSGSFEAGQQQYEKRSAKTGSRLYKTISMRFSGFWKNKTMRGWNDNEGSANLF